MKKFFKKNWWIFLGFIIGIIVMLLGLLIPICLIVGLILIGIMLIVIAFLLRNRYNNLIENQENDSGIFDATKYDYDEDIYIIDANYKFKKQIKKNVFSKLSAQGPSIMFGIFGAGLILFSLTLIFKGTSQLILIPINLPLIFKLPSISK